MWQDLSISIHQPSFFISKNLKRILPEWNSPSVWVIVVLQQSKFPLLNIDSHIDQEKDRLRNKFIKFGLNLAIALGKQGYLCEIIDPLTGYPFLSKSGEITHDDVAVVKALLGFPAIDGKCSAIDHPSWGTAVYPGIIMSSASPLKIKRAILNMIHD